METNIYILFALGVLLTIAITLNGLILCALYVLWRQAWSPTHIYVIWMTSAEIVFVLFSAASMIQTNVDEYYFRSPFATAFACHVMPWLQLLNTCFSTYCMTAVAFDVFRVVCSPVVNAMNTGWSPYLIRRRRAVRAIVIVSLTSLVYSARISLQSFVSNDTTDHDNNELISTTSLSLDPTAAESVTDAVTQYRLTSASEIIGSRSNFTVFSVFSTHPASDVDVNNSNPDGLDRTTARDTNFSVPVDDYSEGPPSQTISSCNFLIEDNDNDTPYRLADLVVLFVVPVAVQTALYLAVARKLWSSHIALRGSVQKTHKYRRFVKMFSILLAFFVVCRGPWHLIDIVMDQLQLNYGWVPHDNGLLRQLALLLLVSNSWMMPVIYSLFNASVRGCLLDSLRRFLKVFKTKRDLAVGCCRRPRGTVESVSTPVGTLPAAQVVASQPSAELVESVFVSADQERFSTVLANVQHSP